jgi:hypothetical protein
VHTRGVSPAAFEPLQITAESSLNRVMVDGARAEDACSRDALRALAVDHGLPGLRPDRLSDDLAVAATCADAWTRRAAAAVLTEFGQRLGALIAALRDPETADREGGSPARRAFLSHCAAVDSVWLAGGLLAGPGGHMAVRRAQEHAAAARRPCHVSLTPYPALAPLLGAARAAATDVAPSPLVVADLGHTSIRTALALRSGVTLTGLRLLPTGRAPGPGRPHDVERAVADALVPAVRAASAANRRTHVRLIVSVAAHVVGGTPVADGQGIYGCLADRRDSLERRMETHSGTTVALEFIHDGTAAAAMAGSADSATITAGTWLGVGFRPANAPRSLDLAPDLQVAAPMPGRAARPRRGW